MYRRLRLITLLLSLVLVALISTATAQETRTTGTVTATIGGEQLSLSSAAQRVPEDAADGVTDPERKAILEKVAGTEQHSATFMVMDPIKAGSVVIVPARLYVTIDTSVPDVDRSEHGGLSLRFSLDPETLDAASIDDVEVLYYPDGWDLSDYYALTEGALTIDRVELVDGSTLAVSGRVEGVLTHQDEFQAVHNPEDALTVSATFEIGEVAGSDVALELLSGE